MSEKETSKKLQTMAATDPLWHMEQIQGIKTLEGYQKNLVRVIQEHDRVCIKACHNVGKTYLMARIVLWFLSSHHRSRVITTAPTTRQVKHLLWAEINAGYKSSKVPLGGECFTTMWKIDPDWFAIGFAAKPSSGEDEDNSSFQGFHASNLLVVFDEATGIDSKIWTQTEGMLTSGNVKFVAIGNPTSRQSVFYEKFQSPLWHKESLSCFDSPNLTVNGIHNIGDLKSELKFLKDLDEEELETKLQAYKIVKGHLLTARWVLEFAFDWGINHPLFEGKVLGEFPTVDEHTLFPLDLIEKCQDRHSLDDINRTDEGTFVIPRNMEVHFGVDVARMGSDKTVIQPLYGNTFLEPIKLSKKDNVEVAGAVVRELKRLPRGSYAVKTVTVDATGLGSGVIDTLRDLQSRGEVASSIKIREAHFGASVKNKKGKEHYANYKAKIFCELSEDMRSHLVLPDDQVYVEQLASIKHQQDGKGRIFLESKENFKRRTGRGSPDEADALALANDGKRSYDALMNFSVVEFECMEKTSSWGV